MPVTSTTSGGCVSLSKLPAIILSVNQDAEFPSINTDCQMYAMSVRSIFCVYCGDCRDAKVLVKKLLQADLSKRWGNLKNGVADIKECKWFSHINFDDLRNKKLPVKHKPTVRVRLLTFPEN
eukprot:GHVT01015288.1.p4 GENE.GHVT01015288.1~~GHVT01015288.1.p4  ORF type:complete len:122 (-),score=7.90 GHVT01015288.1:3768-4133(-)